MLFYLAEKALVEEHPGKYTDFLVMLDREQSADSALTLDFIH